MNNFAKTKVTKVTIPAIDQKKASEVTKALKRAKVDFVATFSGLDQSYIFVIVYDELGTNNVPMYNELLKCGINIMPNNGGQPSAT